MAKKGLSKPVKIIISLATVGVVITGIYFGYKLWKAKQEKKGMGGKKKKGQEEVIAPQTATTTVTPTYTPSSSSSSSSSWASDKTFPLKKGQKGENVKILQKYLNYSPLCKRKNVPVLTTDGKFGDKTESALKLCYDMVTLDKATHDAMKL